MTKFIDIHTHQIVKDENIIAINSLFVGKNTTGLFTVGVHPWQIEALKPNWEIELQNSLNENKCVGLGECGLDRVIETPIETQKEILEKQLNLYKQFDKKIIMLHIVKAYSDIMPFLKQFPEKHFIFHDYNGSPEATMELLKLNCSFSYGKKIFNEKTKAMKSIKDIPLEKLFCETDEHDLKIQDVYQRLAEVKKSNIENVKKVLNQNLNSLLIGLPSI